MRVGASTSWWLSALLFSGVWSGCDCESGGVSSERSSITTSEARVELGRVFVGSEARRTIQLLAPGSLAVEFRGALSGDAAGFIVGPVAGVLAPNGSQDIELIFRPRAAGRREATLTFDSDATEQNRAVVTVIAEGVEAPDCEDGNGCTLDSFDPVAARCVHRAEPVACTDFSACTAADTCVEGVCLGQAMSCDDANPCTDDLCDPDTGCIHEPTRSCDDDNPCTIDRCDGAEGCAHESAPDGTACDDFELCTTADICLGGDCVGVSIPDGSPCDDNEPCSKDERCLAGECEDPSYRRPGLGELVYTTTVGVLAADASANPILDRSGTTYVGLADGVTAVDQCGVRLWDRHDLGLPTWRAATSLPGTLFVPVGDRVWSLDMQDGATLGGLRLDASLAPTGTASTATVTTTIIDMALRGSGSLVLSVVQAVTERGRTTEHGALLEVDRSLSVATVYRRLGLSVARRLVIDRDEALVVVLSDGQRERLVRFGLEGLPETSWSTSASSTISTELSLSGAGEALWTHGLTRVTTAGRATTVLPPAPVGAVGAALVGRRSRLFVVRPVDAPEPALASSWSLWAIDTSSTTVTTTQAWSAPLVGRAEAITPALDAAGVVYVATADGTLVAIDADGQVIFRTASGISLADAAEVALGITPRGAVVLSGEGRVLAIRGAGPLAGTPWPRHRRDNLSSGHR